MGKKSNKLPLFPYIVGCIMSQEKTKERILDVALELFIEHSYDRVTIEMIRKKAGVSVGGLFHHFKTKLELAHACYYKWLTNFTGFMFEETFLRIPSEEALHKIIESSIELNVKNPKIMRFLMELAEAAEKDDIIAAQWVDHREQFYDIVMKVFKEADVKNPKLKAYLLNACMNGLMFQSLYLREDVPGFRPRKIIKELIELFLKD